jgi:DNA-binding SARP family transcriptional activator/predicted ATPase
LVIRLLGAPEVQVDGAPLTVNNQKAQALLFYLAATGRPHTREHLATLLWSESSDRDARHSLRSDLYRLRQALRLKDADTILLNDGELISLRLAAYECDVTHFRQLLAQNDENAWSEGVSLYRGSLLEGFTLAAAPLFEEWVRFEENALSGACLNALEHLLDVAEARQAWSKAIGYVQQIIRLEPLSEAAHQRLISLYIRSDAVGLAVRQYQQLAATLQQELGTSPSAEVQSLVDETLQQRSGAGLSPAISPRLTGITQTLPFVGRDQLLARLTALSEGPIAGRSVTVLLQGEVGIGKTRLVEELADRLATATPSWLVLRGSCSPFDSVLSYGPFLEAFQRATAGDLTGLLTEPHAIDPDARGRFFHQVLQALRTLARHRPTLLVIDDLQWANSSTLNLFGFLATRLRDVPIMLAGTVQSAESIPALQRLITLGRRHGELQLLTLTSLSREAVKALLRISSLSSASVDTLADWLYERSGGSPFILGEILSQLRTEGILTPFDTGWRLDAKRWLRWRATFTLPETTHDLVAWRLANLTPTAQCVLEVAAVAGQPLSFQLLHDWPDLQSDRLILILDDLISRRLIAETENATYILPHHLLRETLLQRLSHIRRRMIHRQLAAALEAQLTAHTDVPLRQIALHAVAGEDVDRARRYGLQVLDELPQDFSATETVEFFGQLYDLLAPTASPEEMLRLTRALGQLHYLLSHIEVAAQWYREHLEIAREIDHPVAQAAAYFDLSELALVTADHVSAIVDAEAGLAICAMATHSDLIAQAGRGQRLLGAALAMEGSDLANAESHLQQALVLEKQTNNNRDHCSTLFEIGNVAAQRGEVKRALESYAEAARAAEAGRVYYYLALAHNNYAYHSLLLGEVDAAHHAVEQGLKLAEAHEMLGVLLYLYSTQGEILLYQADWTAAIEVFQRGLSLAEELNHLERQAGYRAGLALAARGQHEFDRAMAFLEEGLALIARQGYWHLQSRLQIWLAETLFYRECPAEAWPHLEAALNTARQHGRALLLIQAERLRAQLLAAGGDWPGADTLFAEVMQRSQEFGLTLEVARTRAAWGEATLRYARLPDRAYPLLDAARSAFAAYSARADLDGIAQFLTA